MGKLKIEVDDENFELDYNLNVYKVEKENCLPNKRPEKRIRDYYTLTFVLDSGRQQNVSSKR